MTGELALLNDPISQTFYLLLPIAAAVPAVLCSAGGDGPSSSLSRQQTL